LIYAADLSEITEIRKDRIACFGSGAFRVFGFGGGFTRGETFEVCINPIEYVWFDGPHISERENRQLAELVSHVPPTVTAPYTVKY
jgi:hypothetical protein